MSDAGDRVLPGGGVGMLVSAFGASALYENGGNGGSNACADAECRWPADDPGSCRRLPRSPTCPSCPAKVRGIPAPILSKISPDRFFQKKIKKNFGNT